MSVRNHISIGLLLFSDLAAAQQEPDFRSEVRTVNVTLVVLDKKTRKPVRGLGAANFTVYEKGKPRPISSFREVGFGQRDTAATATISTADKGPGAVVPVDEDKPVVAFILDAYNSTFDERHYGARAIADVVTESPGAANWGVYLLSKRWLGVVQEFWEDPRNLLSRLEKYRGVPDPFGAERQLSVNMQLPSSGEAARSEFRQRVIETLGALREVGRDLGKTPGRKSIVWLSAGLPLTVLIREDSRLWHETNDLLNGWNVAVYAVDSAGVRTLGGFSAENAGPRGAPGRPMSGTGTMANTDILFGIAERTGGRAYTGTNNLAASVRDAVAESSHFYEMTFAATVLPSSVRKGTVVPIRVRVAREDVEVRHRSGYFVTKP
ncbi:hypothetical protein F183_A11420 [Bryobacterales bacterium F-183]|nr:hypothetical protein F183_A11420 [Bryobacterales bacterium F-183]